MATVRHLVHDVDAALDFYVGKPGFALVQRRGPPFAIVSHGDLALWLSGPGGRQQLLEDPSGNPLELFSHGARGAMLIMRRGTAVEGSFPSA